MVTSPKVVWMFSGQGSQYHGMGRELYDTEPVFREWLDRCDEIVRPWIHGSLTGEIFRGGLAEPFDDTRLTHLAIGAVQIAMEKTLRARGQAPDLLLGYSLGEAVAHIAGGTLALEAGLALLHRHASVVESATPEGGMLAVLENAGRVSAMLGDVPGVWVAARNFEGHCVVSGTPVALAEVQRRLEAGRTTMQRLPVRRAFHCPLMDPAEAEFQLFAAALPVRAPEVEIISATTGVASTGAAGLWRATREPVDFLGTIRRLEAEHGEGLVFLDLGASGTLATFVKYVRAGREAAAFPTLTPWGGADRNLRSFAAELDRRRRGLAN
ncbi:MAG TPA: acyltransferase domain-containing protein [Opitutus sp.]|nr:acyltransferase domain-containing protein [Opitutus sp.]